MEHLTAIVILILNVLPLLAIIPCRYAYHSVMALQQLPLARISLAVVVPRIQFAHQDIAILRVVVHHLVVQ